MQTIKSLDYPTNLLFFDTETKAHKHPTDPDTERHKFWFGHVLAYRREGLERTRVFDMTLLTIDHFWGTVVARLDSKRPLWCFAHNLMFDLTILDCWTMADKYGINVELPVLEEPPSFIVCKHERGKVVFVNTFNYWKQSVAEIGESIGLPKLKMPKDNKITPAWIKYCKRDNEVIAKTIDNLIHWLQSNNLGPLKYTIAAIALATFKHRFMKPNSIHIHDNVPTLALERASYHGGLTHCYFIGRREERIYKLDVNSLYPYCMLGKYPVRPYRRCNGCSVVELRNQLAKWGAVADVEISSPHTPYPVYDGQRLLEAVGNYRTTLCGQELINAVESDHINQVFDCQLYHLSDCFADYVHYFYRKRQDYKREKNKMGDTFCKLLLNSLYGKFAQRAYQWVDMTYNVLAELYAQEGIEIPSTYEDEANLPKFALGVQKWQPINYPGSLTLRYVGGCLQVQLAQGEHNESCPIIASFVTSYARSYIRKLTSIAGRHNVFYTDTDSLFTNELGYRNLVRRGKVSDKDLGKLKMEDTADRLTIYGPKDYEFGVARVTKGIRSNAVRVCSACGTDLAKSNRCSKCRSIDEGLSSYRQVQFEGIKGVLRRENSPHIDIATVVKTLKREYLKGNVLPSGWTEYPVVSLQAQD